MTDDVFEQRLSTALKTLSTQAIPDEAFDASDLIEWDPLAEDLGVALRGVASATTRRPLRGRRGTRGLTAVVLVLGLGGLGTGIAAAAGAFTEFGHPPTPQEQHTEAVGTALVAPARGNLSPTGHWTATNVKTRLTDAGPDGSTVILQTSSSNAHNGCLHLLVTSPTRPSGPGIVTCSEQYTATHPWTTTTPSTDFGSGTQPWTSPTGAAYVIVFGQAPPGTSSAKLIDGRTGEVVTGDESVSGRFFADPVPQSLRHSGDQIVFYNATGDRVGTSAL